MGKNQQLGERVSVCVAEATRMGSESIASCLKTNRHKFEVCAVAGDASNVSLQLRNAPPDVAVISANLADGPVAGFKVLQHLRETDVRIPAVLLLDSAERDLVIDAFRAGARGIFCRGNTPDTLAKCVRRVHEGQIWINNAEMEFLLEVITNLKPFQLQDPTKERLLTARERDVVRLVAQGMKNEEIAQTLSLRETTVRNYMFHIFDKLGLSSRVEVTLYVLSSHNLVNN